MEAKSVAEDQAEQIMHEINVQQDGIDIMLPKTKFRLIKLTGVDSATANILKQQMLSVGGDAAVSIGTVSCKAPMTDVLLMGNMNQYQQALPKLEKNVLGCPEAAEAIKSVLSL